MNSEFTAGVPGVAGNAEKPQLRVAVIYEDFSTGLRARKVFEEVGRLLDFEMGFELILWRSDILSESELPEHTAWEAKAIDILVLSCHGQRELPAAVKQWLLAWLSNRGGEPSALAVSLDAGASEIPATMATLNLLKSAARLAGVDVFERRWDNPSGPKDLTIEPAHSDKEDLTNRREGPSRQIGASSFQHWGINE